MRVLFKRGNLTLHRVVLLSFFLTCAAVVHADNFTFTASGIGFTFSASGTLTGNLDPGDPLAFDITSATAVVNGIASTLVTPSGTVAHPITVTFNNGHPYPSYVYDNVVYVSGPSLDVNGLLFSTGSDHSNFYYSGGTYYYTNDEIATGKAIRFSITDIPEPATFSSLLGAALVGIAVLRRRSRSQ